jgi:DDE superfamily endonuclease
VRALPDRYELHFEDETHLETNPSLGGVWHRVGQQPVRPAAGTSRRLTVFGSVEAAGRQVVLVCDNGACHASKASQAALADRADWLEVVPLARYSPELNPKEREWRTLKRDHRSHLAPTPRAFVDELLAGLRRLGGERRDVVDEVPAWWVAGHRKEPTGRPPGRPMGAKDSYPRKRRAKNLPART